MLSVVIYEKYFIENTFVGWKPRVLDLQSLQEYVLSSLDDTCEVVSQMQSMFNAEDASPEKSHKADMDKWEMLLASLSEELPDIRFEAPNAREYCKPDWIELMNFAHQLEEVRKVLQNKHATVECAQTSAFLVELCKELKTKIDYCASEIEDFRWKSFLVHAARDIPIPPAPGFTFEGADMQVLKEWASFFPSNYPCAQMAVSYGRRIMHVPRSIEFSIKLDDPPCYIEGTVIHGPPSEPFWIYTHEVYPSKHKSNACKAICSKLADNLGSFRELYDKPQADFYVTPMSQKRNQIALYQ